MSEDFKEEFKELWAIINDMNARLIYLEEQLYEDKRFEQ